MKPTIDLIINGNPLGGNVLELVEDVRVEMALDKATLVSLTLGNPFDDAAGRPRTSKLLFTDSLAFAPGNVVEVYLGNEGQKPGFIAAGIIRKWRPRFPRSGVPRISLTCFDALAEMMDGNDDVEATKARKFERDTPLLDLVLAIATEYKFDVSGVDTNPSASPPTLSVPAQKAAGTSDYQFVRGIANTLGWDFYTTWSTAAKKWVANFHPAKPDDSGKKTFTWGPDFTHAGGVGGLILDIDVEFSVQGQSTDVEVFYFDRGSKTWEKVTWPKDRSSKKKSFAWKGDDTKMSADLAKAGDLDGGRGLRIQAGGVSVEVVPAFGFRSSEEAVNFARSWWRARQDMLLTAKGTTVGYPALRPGQVHEFLGLGDGLSGDWYIAEVSHTYSAANGFETGFVARKLIP